MARVPIVSQRSFSTAPAGPEARPNTALGQTLMQAGEIVGDYAMAEHKAQVEKELSSARVRATEGFSEIKSELEAIDPAQTDAEWAARSKALEDAVTGSFTSENARRAFAGEYAQLQSGVGISVRQNKVTRLAQAGRAQLGETLDVMGNQVGVASVAERSSALEMAAASLQGAVQAGFINPEQALAERQRFAQNMLDRAVRTAIAADPKAALASLQASAITPEQGANGLKTAGAGPERPADLWSDLPPDKRTLYAGIAREQANQVEAEARRTANEARMGVELARDDMRRRVQDDIGSFMLEGKGTGLTYEDVHGALGAAGAADWYDGVAKAAKRHELIGDLARLPPEAAAAKIAAAMDAEEEENKQESALPRLDQPIQSQADFGALARAVRTVETGTNPFQKSEANAIGAMQLLPDTARKMARKIGVTYDERRLLTDVAYNESLGRAYLQELIQQYNGDVFLGVTAYHAGPGNTNKWIRSFGDPRSAISRDAWLARVKATGNPRSAAYVVKVARAMSSGAGSVTWDTLNAVQRVRRTDPARAVDTDEAVQAEKQRQENRRRSDRAEAERGQSRAAAPRSGPSDPAQGFRTETGVRAAGLAMRADGRNTKKEGERLVDAYLEAQERGGIEARYRRPLPNGSLNEFVGRLTEALSSNNGAAITEMQRSLTNQFGKHGDIVFEQVTGWAGQTAGQARAASRVMRGEPVSVSNPLSSNRASSQGAANQAVRGSGASGSQMSNDEVMRAAGLR